MSPNPKMTPKKDPPKIQNIQKIIYNGINRQNNIIKPPKNSKKRSRASSLLDGLVLID